MHKVDRYLLKNSCYIFLLANILAYLCKGSVLYLLMNAVALGLCLLLVFLIRLTVRRYAGEFARERSEVKDLLGRYIEDDKRGRVSFYDYLKRHVARQGAAAGPGGGGTPASAPGPQ